jgi:magnesium transporter
MIPYFRDVADHLNRIYEVIDTDRDLVSGALEAYLSTVSNNLNLVMQRLTIVTVIFLPLTFVTGIFGMNFKVQPWMPDWDRGEVFWTVMGAMTVAGVVLAWWFHRKRLL